ncbi:unnamed protein product [Amoebophrya sp. A25]|nr:unnamed protein product [Amoebophrya sp. A25]|eukprot:GSA25T00022717001.1
MGTTDAGIETAEARMGTAEAAMRTTAPQPQPRKDGDPAEQQNQSSAQMNVSSRSPSKAVIDAKMISTQSSSHQPRPEEPRSEHETQNDFTSPTTMSPTKSPMPRRAAGAHYYKRSAVYSSTGRSRKTTGVIPPGVETTLGGGETTTGVIPPGAETTIGGGETTTVVGDTTAALEQGGKTIIGDTPSSIGVVRVGDTTIGGTTSTAEVVARPAPTCVEDFSHDLEHSDVQHLLTDGSSYEQIPLSSESEEIDAVFERAAKESGLALARKHKVENQHQFQEYSGPPALQKISSKASTAATCNEEDGYDASASADSQAEEGSDESAGINQQLEPISSSQVQERNKGSLLRAGDDQLEKMIGLSSIEAAEGQDVVSRSPKMGEQYQNSWDEQEPCLTPRMRAEVEQSLCSLVSGSRKKIPELRVEVQAHVCGVRSVEVVTALMPLIFGDQRFANAVHTVWAFRASDVEARSCHAVGSKLLDIMRHKSEYESAVILGTVRRIGMYPPLSQTVVSDVPANVIPHVLAQVRELLDDIIGKEDIVLRRKQFRQAKIPHPSSQTRARSKSNVSGTRRDHLGGCKTEQGVAARPGLLAPLDPSTRGSRRRRNSEGAEESMRDGRSTSKTQQHLDLNALPEVEKAPKRSKYSKSHFKYAMEGAEAYDPDSFLDRLFEKPDMDQMIVNEEVLQHFTKADLEALQALRQPHALVEKVVVLIGFLKDCHVIKPEILHRIGCATTSGPFFVPSLASGGGTGSFGGTTAKSSTKERATNNNLALADVASSTTTSEASSAKGMNSCTTRTRQSGSSALAAKQGGAAQPSYKSPCGFRGKNAGATMSGGFYKQQQGYTPSGNAALDLLATRGQREAEARTRGGTLHAREHLGSQIASASGVAWATLKDLVLTKTLRMELVFLHLGLLTDRNYDAAAALAESLSVAEVRRIQPGAAMLLEYAQALLFDEGKRRPRMQHALLDVENGIQSISVEETFALKKLQQSRKSTAAAIGH